MAPIKVYGSIGSPPCRGVMLVVRNLDLDVDIINVSIYKNEQLTKDFLKVNPQHTIPMLDDNGFILYESKAIVAYLVDSRSSENSLYPTDLKKRAIINQRMLFDASTLFPTLRSVVRPLLFLGEKTIPEKRKEKLHEAIETLEKFLENGQEWFAGDEPTLADLGFLATYATFVHMGVNLEKYKNLKSWHKRCESFPGFEENEEGAKFLGEKIRKIITELI